MTTITIARDAGHIGRSSVSLIRWCGRPIFEKNAMNRKNVLCVAVRTCAEREEAERTAWPAPGVSEAQNQVRIVPVVSKDSKMLPLGGAR